MCLQFDLQQSHNDGGKQQIERHLEKEIGTDKAEHGIGGGIVAYPFFGIELMHFFASCNLCNTVNGGSSDQVDNKLYRKVN